ncbi:hypothetical protein [Paenibacillus glacialis]|uniref:tRNA nuclease CdiA C-terminal domain-containing protein n=1 Tax=Paenibacillus glacialis TaxID=494026 RepID=A0A168H3Y3_9BACL|nr:hypothetical protein [Paenibacillus glacialis]OAB37796.1 hypothetical protein PGLA_20715 [Paenibacillus glacialis]
MSAELNIIFGVVAIVSAVFTGGGSLLLYTLAAGELVLGVAEIKINTEKLSDIHGGEYYTNPKFLGMDQDVVNILGLVLVATEVGRFGLKAVLKSGDNAAYARYMDELEDILDDVKLVPEGTVNSAKIPRTGPEWDEYFRSRYGDKNVDWKTSSEYKLYGSNHIPYTPKIRPNAVITKPSLPKGGKPEGNYADTKGKESRGLERQNEAADVLAEQGYRTTMLDDYDTGNGYGLKPESSPDFIIDRQVFDCYAPGTTTNLRNILKTLRLKTQEQARRIVLNLNDYPVEKRAELIEFLKSQTDKDLKYLDELLIIKNSQVTRAYWRF